MIRANFSSACNLAQQKLEKLDIIGREAISREHLSKEPPRIPCRPVDAKQEKAVNGSRTFWALNPPTEAQKLSMTMTKNEDGSREIDPATGKSTTIIDGWIESLWAEEEVAVDLR